ncbi:hypothetical protein [Maridesulfovibrio sp.]
MIQDPWLVTPKIMYQRMYQRMYHVNPECFDSIPEMGTELKSVYC